MGFSIQFESQHVELWAIYTMEVDDDVLEYYDQPSGKLFRVQGEKSDWSTCKSQIW